MPLSIPEPMNEEHELLHEDLAKAVKLPGKVGKAAKRVAQVLHPHFERENEIALPVIGAARAIAEGSSSGDLSKTLQLARTFKQEYTKMLQEHAQILEALNELEHEARLAKRPAVVRFAEALKLHARTEEDLTYPTVLIIEKIPNFIEHLSREQLKIRSYN